MVIDEPSNTQLPPEDRAPSDARPAADAAGGAAGRGSPVGPPTVGKPTSAKHEVVLCHVCGDIMQRAGSCHACPSCGATSGCS